MRIRATKPEFWTSKTIAALPWDIRLVLKGLESYVDDNGVGKDDLALIASDVFPRDLVANPRDTLARLSEAISMLAEHGLIARYEVDDEELLYIDRWNKLQRIDKPAKGRYRRPDGTLEYSEDVSRDSYRSPRDTLANPPEKVAPVTGEQGNRGTDSCAPADADDASDPDRFDDFWDVYGKKVGRKNAVTQWRSALKKKGVTADLLINAAGEYVRRQQAEGAHPKFSKDPERWLKGEHWTDEASNVHPLHPEQQVGHFQPFRLPEAPRDIEDDPERYQAWLDERRAAWQAGERW